MGKILDRADLEAVLGPEAVVAIFGDDPATDVVGPGLEAIIALAEAEVFSYLPGNYRIEVPVDQNPRSIALKMCATDYAKAYALERHPEYERVYKTQSETLWKRAETRMERVVEAVQRLFDLENKPKPRNVGGIIRDNSNRMLIDSADGTSNSGDFG